MSLAECRGHRVEYLKRHIRELAECVVALANDDEDVAPHFCRSLFAELTAEARELRYLSRVSRPGYRPAVGAITDEMIEQARQYPIENLIEFIRQHKAAAWCHDDKSPSLSWFRAKNLARCFPCSISFNPIDVLVQRDGMSFRDAVRQLSH